MTRSAIAGLPAALAACWRRRVARHGRGGWAVLLGVGAAVAAALAYLATAESPWDRGIPEKLAQERELSIRDTIVAGLWLGAALNAVLGAGLLLLSPWWARPLPSPVESGGPPGDAPAGRAGAGRWFWVATLLAVAAAAWVRAPRLEHSFWNDEEQAFRKFTWGEYEPDPSDPGSGRLAFDPAGWDRALFYSVNGNNHVVHTVLAKLCHSAWRGVVRPEPESFREWVIRLEPFTSGLLTILALAAWLRRCGFPLAGVTAGWLLAIHPWVLRYGVEARGYSAMLLFIVLALIASTEAVRTGRWRWWLAFGLFQCLYLLCFAGAVYLAAAWNLLLVPTVLRRQGTAALGRWFVACVLGAMGFLQMMTATVLRIWSWIQAPHVEPFPLDADHLRDFASHLALGVPWSGPEPGGHHGTDIAQMTAASPAWALAFRYALPLLLILGLATALKRSPQVRFWIGCLAGAAGLIALHHQLSELAFFGWYALYEVLGFVVALAFLAEANPWRHHRLGAPAVPLALVAGFLWLGWKPLATQRAHDRHPMRQAVAAVRGEAPAIGGRHAGMLTAAVGSGANQLRTYDPRIQWIKSGADLDALVRQARAESKPLVVYACGPGRLGQDLPEVAARLNDPAQFERGDHLPGQEAFWSFQLYRWRAGD